ncbi:MAG TPA: glutathione peroxidase [Parvularculaceae bacterium]|nr:glutathione peroxidase [Amphiplicatus sp.]MCB9955482.1 glutathione peroxidase [Caulobacterales bacterium]HOP19493.1 glutathione peroxidase [Amphiplicatus sp.]HPE32044.1 glutathione peroxidase [Parvularculaceae bacterium]HRX39088.1 glutathione peroxidase [Parvularculaceae bacterium]
MTSVFDFSAKTIDGDDQPLSNFAGKVLLIVNVASKCGFTPQYSALEALYRKHRDEGFAVLGFPCNQFGGQEPAEEIEIADFCTTHYDVTFPMYSKVDVNGPEAHPLYQFIKKERPGLAGSTSIKWNFTKFLTDRNGKVVDRYAPQTRPNAIEKDIVTLLNVS